MCFSVVTSSFSVFITNFSVVRPQTPVSSTVQEKEQSIEKEVAKKRIRDTKCDSCGGLYTKKGLTKHRNKFLTQPDKHLSNQNK